MSKPVGPYSPWVRAGQLVFCSGQVGLRDGALVEGGLEAEVRQAFVNVAAVLQDAGLTLADVVKATVYLSDVADFGPMNALYAEAFGDHRPARSTVGVAGLPMGARFEIEVVASLG